jgi:toxin secretion/phage lysis holin
MREGFLVGIGAAGGTIAAALGGWDLALQTLFCFMAIDYITGLVVAGIFKRSRLSEHGALSSRAGFKGIIKKCMMILFVLIGYQLDKVVGLEFIRYAVIFAFMANELISIIENANLMGIPIPVVLKRAIGLLKKKGDLEDVERKEDEDFYRRRP